MRSLKEKRGRKYKKRRDDLLRVVRFRRKVGWSTVGYKYWGKYRLKDLTHRGEPQSNKRTK